LNFVLNTANDAARQKDPDFDINKNLFGNLGDDIITYDKLPRGSSPAELDSAPGLFLLGSPNAEQLAGALKAIFVIGNAQAGTPAEREFLGHKIYSVPLPQLPFVTVGGQGGGVAPALNYAAGGGYVAFSTDPAMVEEYLRSSGTPPRALRETPGLTDAAARIGGLGTGWFGYENQADITRATFTALQNSPTNSTVTVQIPGTMLPAALRDWVDVSLLPPFDKISKYFSFSVYAGSENADGIAFKIFSPVPPALRK
jgi:hypothetical protein